MNKEAGTSIIGIGTMGKRSIRTGLAFLGICVLAGCYNDPLDPTQIGRFNPSPAVNVILDTLGVADEPAPVYEGAEDPRPEDILEFETDYVFGSGDIIRISIFELYQEGQAYVNDYIVTETGRISIPDVGLVRAAGLTEPELEQEVRNILSPTILKNPSVTVTLLQSQSRVFSIVGQGVGQAARFNIPRYTFRLLDAIALAGGVAEFNVSYIYVNRDIPGQNTAAFQPADTRTQSSPTRPQTATEQIPAIPQTPAISPEEEMLDIIAPSVVKQPNGLLIASAEMSKRSELETLATPDELGRLEPSDPTQPGASQALLPSSQSPAQIEWVFEDGKWQPRTIEGVKPSRQDAPSQITRRDVQSSGPRQTSPAPSGFGFGDVGQAGALTRVIKIPVDKLLSGNPNYNIIIRPGDRISVPVDLIGEFWVMGNVNAQGAIAITGRPITLKQAIATAGGLGALAWPKKVEVVRRIGRNNAGLMQEETVLVDLQKIARGQQPDFFIKPNDLINVGTHGTSRWQAVLRNAFRATYGFGFIYDRNFADRHYYQTIPDSFHF
jgi:polysaccharide export outer membrane protein